MIEERVLQFIQKEIQLRAAYLDHQMSIFQVLPNLHQRSLPNQKYPKYPKISPKNSPQNRLKNCSKNYLKKRSKISERNLTSKKIWNYHVTLKIFSLKNLPK